MLKRIYSALKEMEDKLNSKIDDISKKLNSLHEQIVHRWARDNESKNYRYTLYLTSDLEVMSSARLNDTILFNISDHINEASAFIEYNDASDDLLSLFQTVIEKYKNLYYEKTQRVPSNYATWVYSMTIHEE